MNSASLNISFLSRQASLFACEICIQRQVSFQFHYSVGGYRPKKVKTERKQRPNHGGSNAPLFSIRVPDAILILPRLFVRNFIFGAEADVSARAEDRHVIAEIISAPPPQPR